MANDLVDFTPAEVERARGYHRPLYAALALDLALGLGVLGALAFGPPGDWAGDLLGGLPWWGQALALPGLAVALSTAVRLPLSFWRGYLHERRFGLSTQTPPAWLGDGAKGLAVGVVLNAAPLGVLVALARALPAAWPAVAAPGAAALVVVVCLVAPIVLEPVFNRFEPLGDEELAREVRTLAERAGAPVRRVLVADASRRTRKANAYVSGLGRTRRLVLSDTLLAGAERREVRLVAAHELGHRRERHLAKATALGALGTAAGVLVLWGLLDWRAVLTAIGAAGPGDPRIAPFVLLVGGVLELVSLPLVSALLRRWERTADLLSLELTGDLAAFEAAHLRLARSNLADLAPPRAVYLLLFTHPTQPERLTAARAWSRESLRGEPAGASEPAGS